MRQVPYPTLGKLVNTEKRLHCRLPVCSGVVREKALGRFLKEGIGRRGGPFRRCFVGARGFRGGVRSPPLRGGGSPARMALRGKHWHNAKGGFLGGARSPRPHGTAVRMPSIPFPPHALTRAPGPSGAMPRSTQCLPLRACRARPSGGGQSKGRWPSGENPGTTRRAVFSEGRGLRARIAKPYASRGIT